MISKEEEKIQEIDVNIPFEDDIRVSIGSISPAKNSFSTVDLDSPFPDIIDIDEESENEFCGDYARDPRESPMKLSYSSYTDYDNDIKNTTLCMMEDDSPFKEIQQSIVNEWFDLSSSKPGKAGEEIAEKIKKIPEEMITDSSISCIFDQLEDLRSTIMTEDTAILFCQSSLRLLQKLSDMPSLSKKLCILCNKAISTLSKIIGDPMIELYKEGIKEEVSSQRLFEIAKKLNEKKNSIIKRTGEFIYKCIVDYIDCVLTNDAIIIHLASTLSKAVHANTNLSTIEAENKTKLARFQQSLLVVIAVDTILDGTESFKELVPLIPPNLIYTILCSIKQDDMMPEKIQYKLIDRFMVQNKCDLSLGSDKILLHQPEYTKEDLMNAEM